MFRVPTLTPLALGLLLALPVQAANPVNGQSLYSTNCASCHGSASAPSVAAVLNARNLSGVLQGAINSNRGGMGFLSRLSAAEVADIAAFLGNEPTSLSFPATDVNANSATQTLSVHAGRQSLSGLAVTLSGDFQRSGGSCGATLAANGSCTVDVIFRPTQGGARSGSLDLAHSGIAGGVQIALSGTGNAVAAPMMSLNGSTLNFGNQVINTASAAQSLTLSNSGSAALNLSAISLSGVAASDYTLGGSCSTASPVAVGASCTISAVFRPTATGSRSASLVLSSNGGNASVALSGTGQAVPAPALSLASSSLDFGSQTVGSSSGARSVTLSNTGTAALTLGSVVASGPFSVTHNCGASLAAGANCALQVVFTPAGAGAASGAVDITSNAAGSPHRLSLAGTGAQPLPTLSWNPAASTLGFADTLVGSTAPMKTLVLSNAGPGAATLQGFALSGAQAADFAVDASSSCSPTNPLAQGASCNLVLRFSPQAAGARAASLALQGQANLPNAVALSGTGLAVPAPVLGVSASSLSFAAPVTGAAPAQTLTLSNTGNAALQISAYGSSGAAFAVVPGASNGCAAAPLSLAAGAQCTLSVSWASTTTPSDSGSLNISSNGGNQAVALSARREQAANNSGGGGCTLGGGRAEFDPLLLVLSGLAAVLLWRRRGRATGA